MKRCVAAVASIFVLILVIGVSYADYFVLKIDLNNLDAVTTPPQPKVNPNPKGGGIMPGKGGPGGGFKGGFGAGGGGFMGGQPGGGFMGGQPGGGFMGGQPGGNLGQPGGIQGQPGFDPKGSKKEYDGPNHWVYVYLEEKSKKAFRGTLYVEFDHQFGKKGNVPNHIIKGELKKEPLPVDFQRRMKDYGKDPSKIIEIANWAVRHGLMKEFHQAMDTLKKLNSPDPSHQLALKSYTQAQQIVKEPLKQEDTNLTDLIRELTAEGYRSLVSDQGHYQLLSNLPKETDASLKRRLARLEEHFEAFYYWFALQDGGPRPQAPKKRLVAVMVRDKTEFDAKHAVWGSMPMAADGFTPRRDNLVILSPRRLDDTFALFEKNTQSYFSNKDFRRDDLVSGIIWDRPNAKMFDGRVVVMQTLAIVHRALEDESERATITHEGTRQLLAASGLLPRTVDVPEWIQFGMASYFETPYGAVYPGFGLPSWTHLVNFKHFNRNKKFGEPSEVLFNLINDRYFRHAAQEVNKATDAKAKEKAVEAQRVELEKGRALAWSLVFYLAEDKKMHYLARYSEELNKLPRDLELDERTLQGCFARAFEMADVRDPNRIDQARFKTFATKWFDLIATYNLEIPDVEREMMLVRDAPPPKTPPSTDTKGPGGLPFPGGNPGFPGGNPGFPGGGKGGIVPPNGGGPGNGGIAPPQIGAPQPQVGLPFPGKQ
jgi:hypothetical protein